MRSSRHTASRTPSRSRSGTRGVRRYVVAPPPHAHSPTRTQTDDLRYVFQRLGFQCLAETLFDDAGRHLLAGALDPRVLVSYYPELCGTLFAHGEEGAVFAGVAECMPPEASIDDISECRRIWVARLSSVVCSFRAPNADLLFSFPVPLFSSRPLTHRPSVCLCPAGLIPSHDKPSSQLLPAPRAEHEHRPADGRAPPRPQARRDGHAQGVPPQVARAPPPRRRRRARRPPGAWVVGAEQRALNASAAQVVDTVLGKLYTVSNETTDLLALIDGPNDVLLPEIEPALLAAGRYDALCRLYKARGAEEKLLDVWYRCVRAAY